MDRFRKALDFFRGFDDPSNQIRHSDLDEFFAQEPPDQPYFLWLGYIDPHRPYDTATYDDPVDPASIAVPAFLVDTPGTRQDLADYFSEIERLDRKIGRLVEILRERGELENTLLLFSGDNGMPFPGAKGTLYEPGIHVPAFLHWPAGVRVPLGGLRVNAMVQVNDFAPTALDAAGVSRPAGCSRLQPASARPGRGPCPRAAVRLLGPRRA